ncbi:MAG: hypothetical protein WBD20_01925 [Pirellulaceae bacterium]
MKNAPMPQTTEHPRLSKLVEQLKAGIDQLHQASEKSADQFDQAILEKNRLAEENDVLVDKLEMLESELNRRASEATLDAGSNRQDAVADTLSRQQDQTERLVASLTSQLSQSQSELAKAQLERNDSSSRASELSRQLSSSQLQLRQTEKLLAAFARDAESATEQGRQRLQESLRTNQVNLVESTQATLAEADRLRSVVESKEQLLRELEADFTGRLAEQVALNETLRAELASLRNTIASANAATESVTKNAADLGGALVPDRRQRMLFDEAAEQENSPVVPAEEVQQVAPACEPPAAKSTKEPAKKEPAKKEPASRKLPKPKLIARPKDDFTLIEGIGPKIRELLVSKRITTFRKLSNTEPVRLERMLKGAGLSLKRYDPSTWPEQAKLAADGNLQRLKELQSNMAKSWVARCVRPVH